VLALLVEVKIDSFIPVLWSEANHPREAFDCVALSRLEEEEEEEEAKRRNRTVTIEPPERTRQDNATVDSSPCSNRSFETLSVWFSSASTSRRREE